MPPSTSLPNLDFSSELNFDLTNQRKKKESEREIGSICYHGSDTMDLSSSSFIELIMMATLFILGLAS